jgi:hypothetical protein
MSGWNTEPENRGGARNQTLSAKLSGNKYGKSKKGWEWVWGDKPTSRAGQVLDPGAALLGQRAVLKTELPHLTGGGANQTELYLEGKASATWW